MNFSMIFLPKIASILVSKNLRHTLPIFRMSLHTVVNSPDILIYGREDFTKQERKWSESPKKTVFEEELCRRWDNAVKDGHFKYKLDDVISRVIPGKKRYIVQFNEKRFNERRTPQQIVHVCQPFNPSNFHFNKIRPGEVLFEMRRREDASRNGNEGSTEPEPKNCVIINISPLSYCHILLVPEAEKCHNQVLTVSGIKFGIETMLLSSSPAFRVGFNSLCAFASVNHLHLHAWYLHHEQLVETMEANELCHGCFVDEESQVNGFVFQVHNEDIDNLSRKIYKVTSCFVDNDIAHNMHLTPGRVFGEPDKYTVRIFLWPRQSVSVTEKPDNPFNIAVAELSGHLPVKDMKHFQNLTEEDINKAIAKEALPRDQFEKVKEDVIRRLSVDENVCNGMNGELSTGI